MNGYAPGTIQTDLGMHVFTFLSRSSEMSIFLTSFVAIEAEKVAGDKTVQEVGRIRRIRPLVGDSLTRGR